MILLDTHVWLWWLTEPGRLSEGARTSIDAADVIGVSAVSAWEVGMLVNRRRIEIDVPPAIWVNDALKADARIREVSLDAAIAMRAAELERDAGALDPADLFILAAAVQYDAALITKDRALREFAPSRTVW